MKECYVGVGNCSVFVVVALYVRRTLREESVEIVYTKTSSCRGFLPTTISNRVSLLFPTVVALTGEDGVSEVLLSTDI